MKETKQAAASAEARAQMHEVMAAFEAFKAANDQRLDAIESKRADPLLEEKVARIDASLQAAQSRLERVMSDGRRPLLGESRGGAAPDERKAAWDGFLRTGQSLGVEFKALSEGTPSAGGYVAPAETERLVERRLQVSSP